MFTMSKITDMFYMLRGKGGIPFRVNGYIPQENGSFDVYIQEGDFIEGGETYEEVWYEKYDKLNVSFDDVLQRELTAVWCSRSCRARTLWQSPSIHMTVKMISYSMQT